MEKLYRVEIAIEGYFWAMVTASSPEEAEKRGEEELAESADLFALRKLSTKVMSVEEV